MRNKIENHKNFNKKTNEKKGIKSRRIELKKTYIQIRIEGLN